MELKHPEVGWKYNTCVSVLKYMCSYAIVHSLRCWFTTLTGVVERVAKWSRAVLTI